MHLIQKLKLFLLKFDSRFANFFNLKHCFHFLHSKHLMLEECIYVSAERIRVLSMWWVPAEEGQSVDQALWNVASLAIVVYTHVPMALRELLSLLVQKERQVSEGRRVKLKHLVQQDVFWGRGKPLFTPDNVSDLHHVVINHVGEVVSWESI